MSHHVQAERIERLNDKAIVDGAYVLYWVQQAQRSRLNHALEYAVALANELGKPLLVAFGLMDDYPEANARHYRFMLEGLHDLEQTLAARGVPFVLRRGAPDAVALELARDACGVVCDRGYLRHQRVWRENVAEHAPCRVVQVESDVVVPVQTASDKKEYAARTLRPKLRKHLATFLTGLEPQPLHNTRAPNIAGEDLSDVGALLGQLKLDTRVAPVSLFKGGESEARRALHDFIGASLARYAHNRNQPQTSFVSHMSKYLHFGHISPIEIALEIQRCGPNENTESYLEELVVRRELPMNFVFYEPHYDRYSALPDWAQKTLAEHADDARNPHYTREQLARAQTHDPYWNAAMLEMKHTGYMHNYMRMYWGKKILEWSRSPEDAFKTALDLNNRYFLDGRDANSYAGVAWVFGQHDRPWTERAIFGKVRYMNAAGLERKAKPRAYVEKVQRLIDGRQATSSAALKPQ